MPALGLAGRIGLVELADTMLTVPGAKGCAGADSIDDLDLLRHGRKLPSVDGARPR